MIPKKKNTSLDNNERLTHISDVAGGFLKRLVETGQR